MLHRIGQRKPLIWLLPAGNKLSQLIWWSRQYESLDHDHVALELHVWGQLSQPLLAAKIQRTPKIMCNCDLVELTRAGYDMGWKNKEAKEFPSVRLCLEVPGDLIASVAPKE